MEIDSNFGSTVVGLSEVRFTGTVNPWSFDTPDVFLPSFRVLDNGLHSNTATAQDGDGGSATDVAFFNVVNVAPSIGGINPSSTQAVIGQSIRFDATDFFDPGVLDTHNVLWEVVTNNGQPILTSDQIEFAFTPSNAGNYQVSLTVTDSDLGSDTFTLPLEVLPVPVITAPGTAVPGPANEGGNSPRVGTIVTLGAEDSSRLAPAGALRGSTQAADREYEWTVRHQSAIVASGTEAAVQFVPLLAGLYSAELTIRDILHEDLTQWDGSGNDAGANDYAAINTRTVGGTFQAQGNAAYLADTTLSTPLNVAVDAFSAGGTLTFDNPNNADTNFRFGFFDVANVDDPAATFGISWGAESGNRFRVANSQGAGTTPLAAGTYGWSIDVDPTIANGRLTISVNGITEVVNNLNCTGLIANVFGLVQPDGTADTTTFETVLFDMQYTGAADCSVLSNTSTSDFTIAAAAPLQFSNPVGLTLEGSRVQIGLVDLAPILEGAEREISWSISPSHADINSTEDPTQFAFTPLRDEVFTINVTVTDTIMGTPIVRTASKVVVIDNAAPTVSADGVSGIESTELQLIATVSDPGNDDTHTYTIFWGDGSDVASGSVVDGVLTHSHTYLQDGLYAAIVTVTDSDGAARTLAVPVTGANAAPVANDDSGLATDEDTILTILPADLLDNDTDVGVLDELQIVEVATRSTGGASITINADGSLIYNPTTSATLNGLPSGQSLIDSFTYVIADDAGAEAQATVFVTVDGRNDLPQLNPDPVFVTEEASAAVSGNILANDSDADNGTVLLIESIAGENDDTNAILGQFGTLNWSHDGSFSYQLDNSNPRVQALSAGNQLVERFDYLVDDAFALTPSALTITITGMNDDPVALDNLLEVQASGILSVLPDSVDDLVLTDGAVAYWRLHEVTGTVISNELSPLSPDGALVGRLQSDAGLIRNTLNRSLRFEGSNYVAINDSPAINTYAGEATAKSFELWMRADAIEARQVLYSQGNADSGFSLYIEAGELYFAAWDEGNFGPLVKAEIAANRPYHVAGVFGADNLKLYLNGALAASEATSFAGQGVDSHPGAIAIGAAAGLLRFPTELSTAMGEFGFSGWIDDVAVYNSALQLETIQSHFRAAGLITADLDVDAGDERTITAINGDQRRRPGGGAAAHARLGSHRRGSVQW